jgi:hypothetical protein
MNIHEKLNKIQQELKAPKGRFNSFGKYAYRSCEDILDAVKPLLNGLTLVVSDEVVFIGNRHYVKATAVLNGGDGTSIKAEAFAREPEIKKGMDEAQITGATSSYARKYALNGLFAIDDAKDADSQDNSHKEPEKINDSEIAALDEYITALEVDKRKFLAYMEVGSLQEITKANYQKAITALKSKVKKPKQIGKLDSVNFDYDDVRVIVYSNVKETGLKTATVCPLATP